MKIRCDFVTNSSSASFVITVKEDIVDANIKHYQESGKKGRVQLLTFLKNELKKGGYKTHMGSGEYYFTIKEFALGKSIELDEKIDPEKIAFTDFSDLSDEEMWKLINWIIIKGGSRDLFGVGATQTNELDCECIDDPRD
ncbi:hypothetical protein [uncultured Methanobacterium sp.]|uniref:hypothetical protein n=1 Tax=uncultured Methanobacterium sp. TaxID=176306 RepID=UPI002AA93283|nr:hypothetical protein [uncultured Methanobacterium sp.]